MYVKSLKLVNFRNYSSLRAELSPHLNVIVGENAQGKTNVLEAIFLCTFARSHRTSKDEQLIKYNTEGAYVGAEVVSAAGAALIEIKQRRGEKKRIYINSTELRRTGDLMGALNSVMFAPETLSIVKGAPQERRRFLDMALSQLYPAYFFRLQQYNAALRQRNALLKDEALRTDTAHLRMWEAQVASQGAEIINRRAEFMERFSHIAARLHLAISGGREFLRTEYAPSVEPSETLEDDFREYLARTAEDDMHRGYTSKGPHRDDIAVILDETDVRYFGSQGQQRTAALAMKLSEIPLVSDIRGEMPILLLDDVFSELDDARRTALISTMAKCQCIITCTSLDGLSPLGGTGGSDTRIFRCVDGTLELMGNSGGRRSV